MKWFLKVKLYCDRIVSYFIRNYSQQDMPKQYSCGKRNQDIAYTNNSFRDRYDK